MLIGVTEPIAMAEHYTSRESLYEAPHNLETATEDDGEMEFKVVSVVGGGDQEWTVVEMIDAEHEFGKFIEALPDMP